MARPPWTAEHMELTVGGKSRRVTNHMLDRSTTPPRQLFLPGAWSSFGRQNISLWDASAIAALAGVTRTGNLVEIGNQL
jgi:hypothetical protein